MGELPTAVEEPSLHSETEKTQITNYHSIEDGVSNSTDVSSITSDSFCSRCCHWMYPSGFWAEFKGLVNLTWPIILTMVCQMIMGPISLIFCGHLGDKIQLDGAALAISMINSTVVAVGQGLGTACDTFFSQSFGSNQYKQAGEYLQKAIIIFLLVLIVILGVHLNMTCILIGLGQDLDVSLLAGKYILMFIPGTFSFFLYVVLSKFVQNQNLVWPNVIIGAIANAFNALLHYLFLYQMNTGVLGSAVAQAMGYFLMFILTLLYIIKARIYTESWDGWNIRCLYGWGKFCKLAIPGMLMVCLEFWSFNVGIFLAGLLGTTELGAQSVLLQIDSVWCQVPMGVQVACSIRVGQYLGAGSAKGAKTAARLALTLSVVISVVMCALFYGIRLQLTNVFTNVNEVSVLAANVMPIVCIYMFFDGISNACKGILYGTGRQIIGAVILFISFYCFAMPLGIPLMFTTNLGIAAFWWGLALSLLLQAIVFLILVFITNWNDQVKQTRERLGILEHLGSGEDKDLYSEDAPPYHQQVQNDVFDDVRRGRQSDDEQQGLLSPSHVTSPQRRRRQRTESELMADEPRRISRHSFVSVSLSAQEIRDLLESFEHELDEVNRKELYLKRLLVLVIMVGVLAIGVATRIFIKPADLLAYYRGDNATTTIMPEDIIHGINSTVTLATSLIT